MSPQMALSQAPPGSVPAVPWASLAAGEHCAVCGDASHGPRGLPAPATLSRRSADRPPASRAAYRGRKSHGGQPRGSGRAAPPPQDAIGHIGHD